MRSRIKSILAVFLPIFSTLFIVSATVIIIALINGYSFDIRKQAVIKTGVLNIETSPANADISVKNVYYGTSNRAIPNLKIGTYTVKITKEGYFPYTKKVEIKHGLATPVIVPLLRVDGQKTIRDLKNAIAQDFNDTGYYILDKVTVAQTPTKTTGTKPEPTSTYLLTRAYVTKPLFDDPKPVLDETMALSSLTATPITAISVSPTGKLVMVTTTDKSGIRTITLVPFRQGSNVNVNLATAKTLTSYARAQKTSIQWTDNGDYLLVETPLQLIAYNVKSGNRSILAEKQELTESGGPLVWSETETGIVSIKKTAGTKTNTYEITDISFNGNPLATALPMLTFDTPPTKIWSISSEDYPRYIVATKKGTYLIGALFDTKSSDYEITRSAKEIAGSSILHLGTDFSLVKISDQEVTTPPIFIESKFLVAFFEQNTRRVVQFTFNKRIADHQTVLGRTIVLEQEKQLTRLAPLVEGAYLTVIADNILYAVDLAGDNLVPLQQEIETYTLGQNDMGILFTNNKQELLFRVLR